MLFSFFLNNKFARTEGDPKIENALTSITNYDPTKKVILKVWSGKGHN